MNPGSLIWYTSDMRKPYLILFGASALLATASPAARDADSDPTTYTVPPFETYQVILDKLPFGNGPAGGYDSPEAAAAAQAAAVTEQQLAADKQAIAKNIKLTCINATPNGRLAVGFTTTEDKSEVNYYLLTGETQDGWTVLSANYVDEIATLKKDDLTLSFKLGKGLVDTPTNAFSGSVTAAAEVSRAATPAAPVPAALPASARRFPPGLRQAMTGPGPAALSPPPAGLSYRERRHDQLLRDDAARRDAELKRQEELRSAVKAAAAEVLAAEKKRQAEEAEQNAPEPPPDDAQ